METINHECYVSLEVAKLLKEAGFDWQDYFAAHSIDEHFHWEIPLHIAQKWLREVKNVDVFAYRNEPKDKFESIVSVNKKWSTTGMCINTYEEALETAIKKALEMILEKGE